MCIDGRRTQTNANSPKYCDVIIKRYCEFTGKQAIHEATCKTYEELANG